MPKMESTSKSLERLDRVEKRAYELQDKYHGCAQCPLVAIQEVYGLRDDMLAKASIVLSGGLGGMGSICGALMGSSLALGMKCGRDVSLLEGPEEKAIEIGYAAAMPIVKLGKWFELEFGSVICREIRKSFMGFELICDIPWQKSIPWQNEVMEQLDIHQHCTNIVAKTARRAAAMIENENLGLLDKV